MRPPGLSPSLTRRGTGGARRELLLRAAFVVDAAGRGKYPLEASVRCVAGADGGVGVGRLHAEVFRLVSEVTRVVVRSDMSGTELIWAICCVKPLAWGGKLTQLLLGAQSATI